MSPFDWLIQKPVKAVWIVIARAAVSYNYGWASFKGAVPSLYISRNVLGAMLVPAILKFKMEAARGRLSPVIYLELKSMKKYSYFAK